MFLLCVAEYDRYAAPPPREYASEYGKREFFSFCSKALRKVSEIQAASCTNRYKSFVSLLTLLKCSRRRLPCADASCLKPSMRNGGVFGFPAH